MLLYLLFSSQTLGIRLTKINDLSWSLVYPYEITKFADGTYRPFCCSFTNEIRQLKYVIPDKPCLWLGPVWPKVSRLFLYRPFTRVLQR